MAQSLEERAFLREQLLPSSSRTFGYVIPNTLPANLIDEVAFGYVVCRIVDIVEEHVDLSLSKRKEYMDDFISALKDPKNEEKTRRIHDRFKTLEILTDEEAPSEQEIGYKRLTENTPTVFKILSSFPQNIMDAIVKNAAKMGEGLIDFVNKPIRTIEDQNRYCHYAAGIVGHMLAELFNHTGYIDEKTRDYLIDPSDDLSNKFGLMLQKLNLTRDCKDDLRAGRTVYLPLEWIDVNGFSEYEELFHPENFEHAENVLRTAINDMANYIGPSIEYTVALPPSLRKFCINILGAACATMRELRNRPEEYFDPDPTKRIKISRDEVLEIGRVAEEIYENTKKIRRFLPYLASHQAKTFKV